MEVPEGRLVLRLLRHLESSFMIKRCWHVRQRKAGICEEIFETHDEKPTNSFLYSLVMDTYSMGYSGSTYTDMPINHKVFLAQFDATRRLQTKVRVFLWDAVQIMLWSLIQM